MDVSFENLRIGQAYDRPYLAELWGYEGYQAISRGVITPSGTHYIILFVTKEKQEALTQYNDYIEGDELHWEGEEKHRNDDRIINASKANDGIHLFYRDIHHSPFVYWGEIVLKEYKKFIDRPSQFVFSLDDSEESPDVIDDLKTHQQEFNSLEQTEKDAITKSRLGQGIFRKRLIELWGGCSITGLSNFSLLRASHVKPWRDSSNQERLDPMNGLLLHPAMDHLFDTGLVTFDDNGEIIISDKLSEREIEILHVDRSCKLRKMPDGLKQFMCIHREKIFENV